MLKFFKVPFAVSGTKATIPDAIQGDGSVSYTEGYNFNYQRPKADPLSRNIERDKANGLYYDITNELGEIQQQGVPSFITSALNGGTPFSYAINAVVRYTDGLIYVSRKAANTSLPTVAADWAVVRESAPRVVATGTADAITATFVPTILPLQDGETFAVRHTAANTSTTPTIAINGGAALTIVKGNNQPLAAGDIQGAAFWGTYMYDATLARAVLLNPATGVASAAPPDLDAVAASVASNALTATVSPGTFAFRNPTLNNGAVNNRVLAANASVVVPAGAPLGGANGVAQTLYLLAIDATALGGGVEAAIVPETGGQVLDERGVINTVAVNTAAVVTASIDAAGLMTVTAVTSGAITVGMQLTGASVPAGTRVVSFGTGTGGTGTYQTDSRTVAASTTITGAAGYGIYSTTQRTGVPYRIVGILTSTQATAGQWATAPSTVSPVGGNALLGMGTLGNGQAWQNVTRSPGVNYFAPAKPIAIAVNSTVTATGGAAVFSITAQGSSTAVSVQSGMMINTAGGAYTGGAMCIIPANAMYSFSVPGTYNGAQEMR